MSMVVLVLPGMAQVGTNKDMLLHKLQTANEDTDKVKAYYALSNYYSDSDIQTAEKYCLLGGRLSNKIDYKPGVYYFYNIYSDMLNYRGHFDSALNMNLEAVAYAGKKRDSIELGRTMLNAGLAYRQLEDYVNAVSYIEGGRDILIRNGAHQYDGFIFNLLQLLYYSMHQYRKAVNTGLNSIGILERASDKSSLQQAYNNLGLNFIHLHLYDSARYYLSKAVALDAETGESMVQITTNLNYALLALREDKIDSIKFYAEKALDLTNKYDANEYKALAQYGLAYYYLLKMDYTNCMKLANAALALANQYNMRDAKQKIYAVLSGLYYAMQNNQKGYYYFNQYELLNDSLLNESITNSTIQIEKKYETERKETQIKLQKAQLRQKTSLNNFLMAGAAVLLIFLLLGYRNYRSRQNLQNARIEELEKEKQLMATEAVLKGEEQERTRLAKDLHDGLGGMLSGIKYSLNNMRENLIMSADNALAFERSIDMLDSSIKEMRRVAHNMMPELLVKYDLNTALREFCAEIDRSAVLHVSYQSIGMDKVQLDQTIAVTIYRIVQELVNNSIKHAAAKNLLVQLHASETDKLLSLTVEDDGRGFDSSLLKQANGIGWNNIKNRVDFLKGKVDINTAEGKGTSVLIELNLV